MNNYNNINVYKKDFYFHIEINRPKQLNALNQATIKEIDSCLNAFEKNNKRYFGIIISGSGEKSFVAGADITEFTQVNKKNSKKFCKKGHELYNKIENMSVPVIALVNGYALGGGCELAMACHLRIATKNATFSQPEVNLGLIPGYGGTQRLIQIIGKTKGLELMLSAEMISSSIALDLGLVNYVLEDKKQAMDKALELINIFKRKSPIAIKNVIKSVNSFYDNDVNGFDKEIELFSECCDTNDFKEGALAFIEKRCPNFKGD
tara:strand:+ start:398 stop:1186 length:789 start_codon:yes stop_codon:yes gene_type:complete